MCKCYSGARRGAGDVPCRPHIFGFAWFLNRSRAVRHRKFVSLTAGKRQSASTDYRIIADDTHFNINFPRKLPLCETKMLAEP